MSINIEQFCSQWTDFYEIWFWGGGVVKSAKTTYLSITSLQECKGSQENSDMFNTEMKWQAFGMKIYVHLWLLWLLNLSYLPLLLQLPMFLWLPWLPR